MRRRSCGHGLLRKQRRGGRREQRGGGGVHTGLELLAEVLNRGGDAAGRTIAERAERPEQDVVADVQELVDVVLGALAELESRHDLLEPESALTTRRALAAGLVGVEVRPA